MMKIWCWEDLGSRSEEGTTSWFNFAKVRSETVQTLPKHPTVCKPSSNCSFAFCSHSLAWHISCGKAAYRPPAIDCHLVHDFQHFLFSARPAYPVMSCIVDCGGNPKASLAKSCHSWEKLALPTCSTIFSISEEWKLEKQAGGGNFGDYLQRKNVAKVSLACPANGFQHATIVKS